MADITLLHVTTNPKCGLCAEALNTALNRECSYLQISTLEWKMSHFLAVLAVTAVKIIIRRLENWGKKSSGN